MRSALAREVIERVRSASLTEAFRHQAGVNQAFHEARRDLIDVSASNLSVEWAAGGLVATARELVLFGSALRAGRLLKLQGMRSLTEWFPARDGARQEVPRAYLCAAQRTSTPPAPGSQNHE
jgi:hypothetical protein